MKRSTLESIISIAGIASRDETRYHLNGVHVRNVAGGKVQLRATNGHMAAMLEVEDKIPDGNYMMRSESIAVAKIVVKECRNFDEIECGIDSEKGLIYGHATKGRMEKAEDFPDLEQVFPKHFAKVAITLNADYLIALAEVAKHASGSKDRAVRIVFDPTDHSRAALIERTGAEHMRAVVMPVRDHETIAIAKNAERAWKPIADDDIDDIISLPGQQSQA